MSNFIDNNVSLPANKTDLVPIPAGGSATNYMASNDYNSLSQASQDIRTVIERSVSIMSFGADPTGTSDNSAAFTAAFSAMSNVGVLHLPGINSTTDAVYKITNNVVVPAGIVLTFDNSMINIAATKTLTISGGLLDTTAQIFTGSGSILFGVEAPGIAVRPQWWGAKPDGSTDCTAAVTSALNSLPTNSTSVVVGRIHFSTGTWKMTNIVTPSASGGIIIEGDGGRGGALGSYGPTILSFASGSNPGLTLRGGGFVLRDLAITSTGSPTVPVLHLDADTYLSKITGCAFFGNATGAIDTGDFLIDLLIDDCYFAQNCQGSSQPVVNIIGNNSTTTSLRKCYFSNNYDNASGMALYVQTLDMARIEDCIFESSGAAIKVVSECGALIEGCYFELSLSTIIYVTSEYTSGSTTIRSCFFNKSIGASGNQIVTTTNSVEVSGCNFSAAFTATTDYLYFDGATLGSIKLFNNSIDPGSDGTFASLLGCDDDTQIGGIASVTNLALHSSFEDASHVTSTGSLTTSQDTIANATGGYTSQKLVWTSNASPAVAVFLNSTTNLSIGDIITISFYAKAAAAVTLTAQWDGFYGPVGQFNINLTTNWKRYVIQAHPSLYVVANYYLYLTPPVNTAVTSWVDGLQVERNVYRAHPLITTTSSTITVINQDSGI